MLRFFPRSIWRYAVLLVLLFAIVAVASMSVIDYLGEHIPDPEYEQTIRELSVGIWTLTMGFMFLAGALGLWAIRSTTEVESRRRIGRFVDTMDYLSDGLLVLDKKGRIAGSNPAIEQLAPRVMTERVAVTFQEVFPSLTDQDRAYLLERGQPREIERDCVYAHGLRTLRFRSQPSEGVILVIVSDVTDMRSQEILQKQTAKLQLVGRIASGVAHDFNDILCAISGHAALLKRSDLQPDVVKKSVDIIADETQRGALLSRQLLELSRSSEGGKPTKNLDESVEEATTLLRVALSPEWKVKTLIDGKYPAVPLTYGQVEQVVLNLGLLTADAQRSPCTVMITLNKPGQGQLLDVGSQFVAVILISAEISGSENVLYSEDALQNVLPVRDDTGVIISVVRSLVEEARGRMDHLTAPGGLCVYRVCLPHMDIATGNIEENLSLTGDLYSSLSGWHVLLGDSTHDIDALENRLRDVGTSIERKDSLASILACVQSVQDLDAIVIDKRMLGTEANNLLAAIVKLSPQTGIVVLCQDPEGESRDLHSTVVFEHRIASPQQIFQSIVNAKDLVQDVASHQRN